MGLLDKILNRKSKPTQQDKIQPTQDKSSKLDLSKKIGLNFEKMSLSDPEVIRKRVFLLDISGSMDEKIDDKSRKIDHLRNIMEKYPAANMLCFSSEVEHIKKALEIPKPNGGTDLALALKYVKVTTIPLPERVVLISDGEPNDKEDAISAAKKLGLPIDIIFIGYTGSSGEKFMEELAKITNGTHFVV